MFNFESIVFVASYQSKQMVRSYKRQIARQVKKANSKYKQESFMFEFDANINLTKSTSNRKPTWSSDYQESNERKNTLDPKTVDLLLPPNKYISTSKIDFKIGSKWNSRIESSYDVLPYDACTEDYLQGNI